MLLTSAPQFNAPKLLNNQQPQPPAPKSKEIANYTGPTDGESHYDPNVAPYIRTLNHAIVGAWMRTDKKGLENIPETGAHMLCFNHLSYSDASLVTSLSNRDIRFMAAKEQFTGFVGKAMTAMGAIPVDRKGVPTKPLEVFKTLLDSGKSVAIAPEGGIKDAHPMAEFKEGPAKSALESKCETMIPVVVHYQPHTLTAMDRIGTYAAAGSVVAAGMAAAAAGGPVVRAVAGLLTGALTGAAIGGGIGFARSEQKDIKEKLLDAASAAKWGALAGAATGGIGGVALANNAVYLATPLSLGAGVVALGAAKAFSSRKEAYVVVGEGIPVAPYREMADDKEARTKLTHDLRERMVEIKLGIEKSLQSESA